MQAREAIQKAHRLAHEIRDANAAGRSSDDFTIWGKAAELAELAEQIRDPEYNGWANYETWAVNLWLGNDAALYERTREMVAETRAAGRDDDAVARGTWTVEQAERFRLADALKEWVRDELAPDLGATFAADLLGSAIDEVDWDEIAAALLSDE